MVVKTTVNKTQDSSINTEEATTLKNKIKLLELENSFLKNDVINKHKLIDTIVQHRSKLSQEN